jgi:oligopeptide transport system substrate-binding protein
MAAITSRDSFNKTEALKYRDLAKQELAGKATFPVKVPMPFNSSSTDWTNRVQVVEQQLEGLLGSDYIDVIPVSFPPTNFLTESRRAGKYAIQECNGGPGFVDPDAYTGIFMQGNTLLWSSFEMATEYLDANGKNEYAKMIEKARAEVKDPQKRYQLFAEAEAWLINQAVLIPYAIGGGGYVATKLEPMSQPWSLSLNGVLYKYARVLPKPMNTEQYKAAYTKWEADRAAALKAAAGGK